MHKYFLSSIFYIITDEKTEKTIVKENEPHIALYADNNGLYFHEEILKNIKTILRRILQQ